MITIEWQLLVDGYHFRTLQAHLRRVLQVYINDYYNVARPHQGIKQQTPIPRKQPINACTVQRRKVLDGIISDYYRASGNTPVYLS